MAVHCAKCQGTGKCQKCAGTGRVVVPRNFGEVPSKFFGGASYPSGKTAEIKPPQGSRETVCSSCGGTGKCQSCGGPDEAG